MKPIQYLLTLSLLLATSLALAEVPVPAPAPTTGAQKAVLVTGASTGIGAAIGMLAAVGLELLTEGEMFQRQGGVLLPIVAVFMITVGLLAAVGPARRGLNIQPTEALREE